MGEINKVSLSVSKLKPSKFSKGIIIMGFFDRGIDFYNSALSLNKEGKRGFAFLYILAESLELILKGYLLAKNYDIYKPKLKKIHHNLVESLKYFNLEFDQLGNQYEELENEVISLSNFYKDSKLRYGGIIDIIIDPNSIKHTSILEFLKDRITTYKEKLKEIHPQS